MAVELVGVTSLGSAQLSKPQGSQTSKVTRKEANCTLDRTGCSKTARLSLLWSTNCDKSTAAHWPFLPDGCRHKDPALVQQVMQGLPFLSFVGEHNSSQQDPTAWLAAGESSLGAWRAAEEELHRTHQKAGPVAASGMACVGQEPLTQVAGSATPASNSSSQSLCWLQGAPEGDSFAGEWPMQNGI